MKLLRELILFIIDDFKKDVQFLQKLFKGELKIDKEKLDYKSFDLKLFLKEYWSWYLLIILAFFTGFFYSAMHYQAECNLYIQEEVIPQCDPLYSDPRTLDWQYADDENAHYNTNLSLNVPYFNSQGIS